MALPWALQNKGLPYSSANSQSIVNLLTNEITVNRAASFGQPNQNLNSVFEIWTPVLFHKEVDIDGTLFVEAIALSGTLTANKLKTKALEGQWPVSGAGPQGLPKTISNGSPTLGTGLETPAQWHTFIYTEASVDPATPPPGSIYKIPITDAVSELIYLMDDSGGPGYSGCRIEFPDAADVTLSEFDNITFTLVNLTPQLVFISAGQNGNFPIPANVNSETRGTNQIGSIDYEILANGGSNTFRLEGTQTGYNVWAIN